MHFFKEQLLFIQMNTINKPMFNFILKEMTVKY